MTATTTTTRTTTARKVLGSLGVIGAAAAVAGMGTFGTFTDSTAPLNASVTSGTLSLDLTAGGTQGMTMSATNFVPGDSISRSVELVNSGNLAFAGISLASSATTSSILDTDRANGLQLSAKSCSVVWTETVTNGVATYTCSGTTTNVVASNPAVLSASLPTPASANPNGRDHLLITVSLPTSAGNEFQGKTSSLSINFTGTQQTGSNR